MTESATPKTSPVSLFRRAVPIVVGLVGLVFAIVGAAMLTSLTWDKATGTLGQCSSRTIASGSSNGRTVEYTCDLTWQQGGSSHSGHLVTRRNVSPGMQVDLRVKGDNAIEDAPVWAGAGTAGLGVALVVVSGVLILRGRRPAA